MGRSRRRSRPVSTTGRPGRGRRGWHGGGRRRQRPSSALRSNGGVALVNVVALAPQLVLMAGMPVAELNLPGRLLAGGGPGSPDPRVLRALTTPVIGQFDPDFTAIMDDVMDLARQTFLTNNARCFPVSGLAPAGLEAVCNTLIETGDTVAIGGGPRFVADTAELARRCGAEVMPINQLGPTT